ncbi:MAG TPA: hypothetical protein VFI27_04885 [candidate division Zixibacteria bacterium]|nr:hypothetical protein [candidate division Zixibacteria bacterium]
MADTLTRLLRSLKIQEGHQNRASGKPADERTVLSIGLFLSVLRGFIEVDEGVLFLSQGPSDRGASATF